ncbi:anthranilate synthase subunit II [Mycobacterium tuberculosis]|nr:anthranilate synthase subunit II [Mycobacterium tuberculosis]
MRILVVDNYDSFVFNLVQYLGQLGIEAEVWRNDDHRLSDEAAVAGQFDGVLLSPGPGTPERAGASVSIVHACAAAHTPLLGVCLGHQAIGVAFGATVDRAPELLHGKTSSVFHTNVGVLQGLPDPFTATRYHSLTILPKSLPAVLRVTARTKQRCDHGRAAHRAADPRCPVPSGVDSHRGRAPHTGQLAHLLRMDARRHPGTSAGKRSAHRHLTALPNFNR